MGTDSNVQPNLAALDLVSRFSLSANSAKTKGWGRTRTFNQTSLRSIWLAGSHCLPIQAKYFRRGTSPLLKYLVEVTGLEPAASSSQTLKYRFFPYFTRLFGAFVSENGAFRCSSSHCFHVVRSRRWSKMWSNYNHPRFRAEEFIQCHSQINLINRKYYTINSLKSQDYISGEFVMQSILSTLKN